jgi:hypothetical protein
MEGQEFFTLTEIGRGAAVERFDLELQKVLDNIQDPNTDPRKARSVVLKFTITPDEDRGVGKYAIDAQAKLAPLKSHPGRVFLGRDQDGHGMASEEHPSQVEMKEVTEAPGLQDGKVYKLGKEAKG